MFKLGMVQVNDVIGINVILPLAIGILWQSAKADASIAEKWCLDKIVYRPVDNDDDFDQLAACDIVCFSTYLWNSRYHVRIAKEIKKRNPNVFILFGGPNVSQAKHDFWLEDSDVIDLAIVGEGEHAFHAVLKQWPQLDVQTIPGAWTPDYFAGEAPRIQNFEGYVSPYLDGFYDDIIQAELANGLLIQAVLQTNRGCPYHCSFCEEGAEYKNKMYFYDFQRLRDEIEYCARNRVSFLSLADDNWGIADRDIELMQWIVDCRLKYGYPEVVDATYAKNAPDRVLKICEIDRKHNTRLIRGVTIALQSVNDRTLTSIQRFNLIPEKQARLIAGLKSLEVPTYTEMIWPLPHETYETFLSGIEQTVETGLDNWLGVYPLHLHPGTQLWDDYKDHYTTVATQRENDRDKDSEEIVNVVKSSQWVDNSMLIKGQVFYAWLTSLFFFGFTRNGLCWLKKNRQIDITTSVHRFIEFVESRPECKFYSMNTRLKTWWYRWSNGMTTPDLSEFPGEDTRHWFPYTHLASWIQSSRLEFYEIWKEFLETHHCHDIVDLDRDSTVIYGTSYPYQCEKGTVSLVQDPPEFRNLFEFSRYYYWWKRKNGWHRTQITQ